MPQLIDRASRDIALDPSASRVDYGCHGIAASGEPDKHHGNTIRNQHGQGVQSGWADQGVGIRCVTGTRLSDDRRMRLVHEAKRTGPYPQFRFEGLPRTSGGARVTPDAQREVSRAAVGEGNPDTGRYLRCPEEHRLFQEVGNVQIIRASGRVVRFDNSRQIDIEAGVTGNVIATAVVRVL